MAVFDADPGKCGMEVAGLKVRDVSAIPRELRLLKQSGSKADIGIVAVPAAGAQQVAELLAENGVGAILNFAPVVLQPMRNVTVGNVDLAVELEKLCYYLTTAKTGAGASHSWAP